MKKVFTIAIACGGLAGGLSGCQSFGSLTPSQDAQLICLATTVGQQIAATHTNPLKSAQIQADGSTLCTFATGAAVVVTPSAK